MASIQGQADYPQPCKQHAVKLQWSWQVPHQNRHGMHEVSADIWSMKWQTPELQLPSSAGAVQPPSQGKEVPSTCQLGPYALGQGQQVHALARPGPEPVGVEQVHHACFALAVARWNRCLLGCRCAVFWLVSLLGKLDSAASAVEVCCVCDTHEDNVHIACHGINAERWQQWHDIWKGEHLLLHDLHIAFCRAYNQISSVYIYI